MDSTEGSAPAVIDLMEPEDLYRLLAENASDVVGLGSTEGVTLWVSDSVTALLGWLPGDLVGQPFADLVHPDDLAFVSDLRRAVAEGDIGRADLRLRTAADGFHWLSVALRPIVNAEGTIVGRVAAWRDAEHQHAAQEELIAEKERYRLLAENASDVVVQEQPDGTIFWVTSSITAMLGWGPEDLVGRRAVDFLHPDDVSVVAEAQSGIGQGQAFDFEARVRTSEGDYRWVASRVRPVLDDTGAAITRVAAWRDIEDEHAAREALLLSEEKYRLLAENTADVVMRSRDNAVVWVSPSLTSALGWMPDDWIGHSLAEFGHPDDLPTVEIAREEMTRGRTSLHQIRFRDFAGSWHWVQIHAQNYRGRDGVADGYLSSFRVIDNEVAVQEELERLARFDSVTGVLNRQEVLRKLGGMSAGARRAGPQTAVLFCDVDRFKGINDSFGHAAGDEVLRTLARRIGVAIRDDDHVARIGGDEFLVVLTWVHSLHDAAAVAEKIRDVASTPIDLAPGRVSTSLSIGVTLMHSGETVDDLVARADHAMYRAKEQGRNKVVAIDANA